MYGTQAKINLIPAVYRFENDVKMYGTQAVANVLNVPAGLRMM